MAPEERAQRVVERVSLLALVIALSAAAGLGLALSGSAPYRSLERGIAPLGNFLRYGQALPMGVVVPRPTAHPAAGLVLHPEVEAAHGVRAFLGHSREAGRFAVQIFGPAGERLGLIPVDFDSIHPEAPPEATGDPHDFLLLPDGGVVVNFDMGEAMARLDACGSVVWVRREPFHHSLARGDDGLLWTWQGGGSAYDQAQYITAISADTGQTVRRIALLDIIDRATPAQRLAFSTAADFVPQAGQGVADIFHPNDVEPLPAAFAAAFPGFPPGALLLSLRNPNLVAVVDPDSLEVLWHSNGPWIRQHDPDWLPDGRIAVFNNNNALTDSIPGFTTAQRRRSSVLTIRPFDAGSLSEWPTPVFGATIQGKIERLPGGHLMVTVPEEGRVMEVSQDGRLAAHFNNSFAKSVNGRVTDAHFLPAAEAQELPVCKG